MSRRLTLVVWVAVGLFLGGGFLVGALVGVKTDQGVLHGVGAGMVGLGFIASTMFLGATSAAALIAILDWAVSGDD